MSEDKNNNKRKKKKKKKKFRKLFISTAAFFTAAVVVVFCFYYMYFETSYFDLVKVDISGNETYNKEYILQQSKIELGSKIFETDRTKVKENIENEIYIESAKVVYELPNKIYIEVKERKEKYQIFYNNEFIITDKYGIVLNTSTKKNELLSIESLTEVIYNVGDSVQFDGIDNINSIFDTIEYISSEVGSETMKSVTVDRNNSILLATEYGTMIKIRLCEDIKYQIVFAMKIINERLNNNLTVSNGLIDFTKGDSPVYIEDFKMEEYNE
ncbi:MAG: FtsQ-type POTRA domain-containing protein [Sedimentibacter sp.]|uniref:cell division protein FtsQ/DivIB n=1 Tax=Sedimentibacter sp. TaxID=1960295 RepID=UPI0029822CC6|nr:FtsQ-type POTRA domain-containing protein [Sedimentibacter sp.]MDW5298712.1 FtsQ-type POTRA domain-containing protein [Sedimentibacter sp.]